ncbi:MAG TPA: nucleotidyltransferase family protein [Acidimicrobiales bacterium]|nr:nucleotidyltransferase family protein [Acidimicrobiales bacterium]
MGDVDLTHETVSQPTIALLWEACRRTPDIDAVRVAAEGDLQPATLVHLALANRIGPLLWRALRAAGCEDALGPERSRIEELAHLYALQEMLLHPQIMSLSITPLTRAGFEPVIMKGPSVARRYPATGLRPMDDLDLLLPREGHVDAVAVLREAGWNVSRPQSRDWYDTQLRHPDVPSMPLELHYGLEGWHERSNRLDPMWLWAQRRHIECLGVRAFGLPVEEEIVSLAAHAGKPYHGFDRMLWLADLGMVIGHATEHEGVDWQRIEELARTTQCATVVGAALRMATRMGLTLPEGRFPLPESGWRSVPLQRLLAFDWPVSHDSATFHIRFALVDSPWRRLVLMGASPYSRTSWQERFLMPPRAVARVTQVWRDARAQSRTAHEPAH